MDKDMNARATASPEQKIQLLEKLACYFEGRIERRYQIDCEPLFNVKHLNILNNLLHEIKTRKEEMEMLERKSND